MARVHDSVPHPDSSREDPACAESAVMVDGCAAGASEETERHGEHCGSHREHPATAD